MSVTVTSPISAGYTPNGVTTDFAFDFKVSSTSEITVVQVLDGVVSEVDSADYDVTLAVDGEGGTVSMDAAPIAGTGTLYILSDPLFTQTVGFGGEGPFTPVTVGGAFDRAAIRDIILQHRIDRAPKVPVGETIGDLPAEADRASSFASYDADGNPASEILLSRFTGAESDIVANADAIVAEALSRASADTALSGRLNAEELKSSRAVMVPGGEGGHTLPSASTRANKWAYFNPDGALIGMSGGGGGADALLRDDLAAPAAGSLLIMHKALSVAGVTTYARTVGQLKALGADDSDGVNLIHFIDSALDGAILMGDYSTDTAAMIDNAVAECRAVELSTGRRTALLVPPYSFRHDAGSIALDVPNMSIISNYGQIVTGLAANDPLFLVTADGFTAKGLRSLVDAAVSDVHHWDIRGDSWTVEDCHWDYDTPQDTPSGYIRQANDGRLRFCTARGANAVFGFIEGSRNLFLGSHFYAEAGGDDPFALKSTIQPSEGNRFIGNYLEGFAAGLSMGSHIGKATDDTSREFRVVGTVFDSNIMHKCASFLKIRPGGSTSDLRYGYAEVSASNNTLIDIAGEVMQTPVQLLPGRHGEIGSVTGKNNKIIGRYSIASRFLLSAGAGTVAPGTVTGPVSIQLLHYDPWSGAANGATITAVGSLGPDPAFGYDIGETVPGYPMESATSIVTAGLTVADQAFEIDMDVDGTAINGVIVPASLDGKVAIRRFRAKNFNATNNANGAGIRTASRVEMLSDDIHMERTSKIHASSNNPYRCESGTDGEIVCNRADTVHFAESVAAGTDKTKTLWAAPRGAYVAKVELLSSAAVAQSGNNTDYISLTVIDPDNGNTGIGTTVHNKLTAGQAFPANTFNAILEGKNITAALHHRVHFDRGERLQVAKIATGAGNALADVLARIHWAPF